MNEIWERVLANSFSGIHKSKIICSVGYRCTESTNRLLSNNMGAVQQYCLSRKYSNSSLLVLHMRSSRDLTINGYRKDNVK